MIFQADGSPTVVTDTVQLGGRDPEEKTVNGLLPRRRRALSGVIVSCKFSFRGHMRFSDSRSMVAGCAAGEEGSGLLIASPEHGEGLVDPECPCCSESERIYKGLSLL